MRAHLHRRVPYREEWVQLIAALEATLRLDHHEPGALAAQAKYLHQRTGGMIGSLTHLIRGGLADIELARIERDYDFEFAADHRAFLAAGLPLDAAPQAGQTRRKPWPNWRDGNPRRSAPATQLAYRGRALRRREQRLLAPRLGPTPGRHERSLQTARQHLYQAPKMIPICGHRYLPAGHGTYGHPILSVYQTDIIVYRTDLADYITNDFSGPPRLRSSSEGHPRTEPLMVAVISRVGEPVAAGMQ